MSFVSGPYLLQGQIKFITTSHDYKMCHAQHLATYPKVKVTTLTQTLSEVVTLRISCPGHISNKVMSTPLYNFTWLLPIALRCVEHNIWPPTSKVKDTTLTQTWSEAEILIISCPCHIFYKGRQIHYNLPSCQPRVTVTSCFVYKVIRDLESIDHLCINHIRKCEIRHKWYIDSHKLKWSV